MYIENDEMIKDRINREQILNIKLEENEKIKIIAVAGSGKTTMLRDYALNNKDKNFLFIAYNKSTQQEKEDQFRYIPNIKVKTLHSLALGACNILKKKFDLQDNLELEFKENLNNYKKDYQYYIKSTLINFCNSSDFDISKIHLPKKMELENYEHIYIINHSKNIWNLISKQNSDNNYKIKISHDIYLKYFQLNKHLHRLVFERNVMLLVDEAHDFNSCSLNIVENNFKYGGIIVYDPHQSIYQFKGSVDTVKLDLIGSKFKNTLNFTFRFGKPLSILVTNLIRSMKRNYKDFQITTSYDKITTYEKVKNVINCLVDDNGNKRRILLLSRTNVNLVIEGINILLSHPFIKLYSFGGSTELKFQIKDIRFLVELKTSKKLSSENRFRKFFSLSLLEKIAEKEEDITLISKIKFVKNYSDSNQLLRNLDLLENSLSESIEFSDIILSTVHKSKGSEQDYVYLSDDFILNLNANNCEENIEEINVLYVAMTRATKCLYINETIYDRMIYCIFLNQILDGLLDN